MPVKAIVPGTFDPVTLGHVDIIRRAARLFDEVVVGVAASPWKNGGPTFSLDERVALVREVVKDLPNVTAKSFNGLLMHFARSEGAVAVVKGLRQMTDFEHEFQQAALNLHIDEDIESIFIATAPKYGYISSSVAKEMFQLGGDVSEMVAPVVVEAMSKRIKRLE